MKKGYLILSSGQVFEGECFGADIDAVGELVFTTGMVGYIETLTDPSYAGQIIMQTFPLIGNYGIIEEDFEGKPAAKGYVVREWCDTPSNFRSQYSVDEFLKRNGIPGLCGVDTREITRIIRNQGVMNAMIASKLPSTLDDIRSFSIRDTVAATSDMSTTEYPAIGQERAKIALIDYGAKKNIIRELQKRGCAVTVLPYDTSAEAVIALRPDGVVLSNGPGDPADNVYCIEQIAKLVGKLPIFGVCLGHQLLAIAMGGKTIKLKYGHRGANQPVREIASGCTYITSQNHGYAVVGESIKGAGNVSFVKANDNTCEGAEYPSVNAFSVQFHPEACAGPRDTMFLFDRFVDSLTR